MNAAGLTFRCIRCGTSYDAARTLIDEVIVDRDASPDADVDEVSEAVASMWSSLNAIPTGGSL